MERRMRRKKMALFLRGTAWFSSRPILAAVTRSPAIKALAAAICPNKSEATELQKHTEHAPHHAPLPFTCSLTPRTRALFQLRVQRQPPLGDFEMLLSTPLPANSPRNSLSQPHWRRGRVLVATVRSKVQSSAADVSNGCC